MLKIVLKVLNKIYYRLIIRHMPTNPTSDTEKVTLITKRNQLQYRINQWRRLQSLYMPFVSYLLAESVQETAPEHIPLFLPSQLSLELSHICSKDLQEKEAQLRLAQLSECLSKVSNIIYI